MDPSEVADALRRAAAGDQMAWDGIVDSFSGLLWSIAHSARLGSADAGEVVQSTWLRLLENIDQIREPERLGGWLATTARRECLRVLKVRSREIVTDDETQLGRGEADFPTPEDRMLDSDRDRRVWLAFARLPENCQRLLRLVVLIGPSYAEVAVLLDMPVGSIGPTRARCLERLRRHLVSEGVSGATGT